MRRVGCVVSCLFALLLVSGCNRGSNEPSSESQEVRPDDVSGSWTWTLDPLACSILDGFLNAQDNLPNEVFNVFQDGSDLDADFEDSVGNAISIRATVTGDGLVNGTITITAAPRVVVAGDRQDCTDLAWASNGLDDTVQVIAMETMTERQSHDQLPAPARGCLSADKGRVFIPDSFLNQIGIYDGAAGGFLGILDGGSGTPILSPSCCALSPDGLTLYVGTLTTAAAASTNGVVYVVDVPSNTVTDTILTPGEIAADMSLSSDGATLFVVNSETRNVDVIDTASRTATNSIFLEWQPTACELLPDDFTLLVTGLPISFPTTASLAVDSDVRIVPLPGTDVTLNSNASLAYVSLGLDEEGGSILGGLSTISIPMAAAYETQQFTTVQTYFGTLEYSACIGICSNDRDLLVGSHRDIYHFDAASSTGATPPGIPRPLPDDLPPGRRTDAAQDRPELHGRRPLQRPGPDAGRRLPGHLRHRPHFEQLRGTELLLLGLRRAVHRLGMATIRRRVAAPSPRRVPGDGAGRAAMRASPPG